MQIGKECTTHCLAEFIHTLYSLLYDIFTNLKEVKPDIPSSIHPPPASIVHALEAIEGYERGPANHALAPGRADLAAPNI